jgi:hypothetical protein
VAQTILYVDSRPVGIECSDLIDAGKPPKKKPEGKPE